MSDGKLNLTSIGTLYGPYAFGVIALLTIWFSIVKPELDRNRLDYESYRELVTQLEQIYHSQAQIARSLEQTAETMSATAVILENTMEKAHAR